MQTAAIVTAPEDGTGYGGGATQPFAAVCDLSLAADARHKDNYVIACVQDIYTADTTSTSVWENTAYGFSIVAVGDVTRHTGIERATGENARSPSLIATYFPDDHSSSSSSVDDDDDNASN